jgi:hypothetical protein
VTFITLKALTPLNREPTEQGDVGSNTDGPAAG